MHITIRRYTPADLDQILTLFHDTVHTINIRDYSQQQVDAWAPSTLDRDRWASKLAENITYVAEIDNQIVGFADATQEGSIDHVYTHKDFQRQGIASALLKQLEQELQKLQITEFFTHASITAKPFFEKHGYMIEKKQEMLHRSGVILSIM